MCGRARTRADKYASNNINFNYNCFNRTSMKVTFSPRSVIVLVGLIILELHYEFHFVHMTHK